MRERNEALDCRVYARAAAWIAGADRYSERRWRRLETALGIGESSGRDGNQGPADRKTSHRRVTRSKWMG